MVKLLLKWLGVGQTVTLVNNPQADGVERVNREVMKLLKMIVADERLKDSWSDFSVLAWIQIQLNSWVNSSTGFSPFELQYGTIDYDYANFPLETTTECNAFVTKMGENLELVRSISKEILQGVKLKYSRGTVDKARVAYKPGEFVFLLLEAKVGVGNKLNSCKKGPYMVVAHEDNSNLVTVKDLVTDKLVELNQKDLQVFLGIWIPLCVWHVLMMINNKLMTYWGILVTQGSVSLWTFWLDLLMGRRYGFRTVRISIKLRLLKISAVLAENYLLCFCPLMNLRR